MYIVHDVTGCMQYLLATVLKFHCSMRSEDVVVVIEEEEEEKEEEEEVEEDGDFALSLVWFLPSLLDGLSSASW